MDTDDRLQGVPEWLEDFTENLEEPEIPVPAHISKEDSDSERPTNVVGKSKLTKHSICTHFPKRPKLRRMFEDQNYKDPLQTRHW